MPDSQPAEVTAPAAAQATPPPPARPGLMRNTMYLTLAQVVTIPIAIAANAVAARYLGPVAIGMMYTASTACSLSLLALEWGQTGAIPALVARNHANAGGILGTGFAWRLLVTLPLAAVLALTCVLFEYDSALRWTLALSFPLAVLNSLGGGLKDTIRGFERTDIPAKAQVAQQVLNLLLVLPVLMLGGSLLHMLSVHIAIAAVILLVLARLLKPLLLSPVRVDRAMVGPLFSTGTPFVFFGLALAAQPYIDALFLNEMAPAYVVGWHAVTQRLIGLLIFPATALIGALYPTLCRLYTEDREEFVSVTRNAIYGVSLLAVPAAVGAGLFPELGVMIYGRDKFGGAESNLQVQALFLLLVYVSMPLGTAVLAANRQKVWALVQCISIGISCTFNPLLIPYFQRTAGNGSLATCWGIVCGELLIVLCGAWLTPAGIFDRTLAKSLLLSVLSGAVMTGVALLLKPVSLLLAVPASLAAYVACAWVTGALQPSTIQMVKRYLASKLNRAS